MRSYHMLHHLGSCTLAYDIGVFVSHLCRIVLYVLYSDFGKRDFVIYIPHIQMACAANLRRWVSRQSDGMRTLRDRYFD
jgi:hypothetical protein